MASGTRFGKYTLVRQLAVGGMAEIYLARADGIGKFAKQVVLKRILPQHASDETFIEMFLHEARAAARLQHPNVVQVFDIGEADGSYFFSMEYVDGDDVRSLLSALRKRSEQMPIDHALAIAIGAAAGLHHAHDQVDDDGRPLDMVHRDISPSNLMLSFDGAVKVTDFGIAKTSAQVIQTRSGVLKGKIQYMSPEQCKSEPLDRRSDIFSLGIVLHELVTGKKLFRAENEYAILRQIIESDAPRLSASAERPIPPALDDIVARALARDRDARYPTAQALQVDLEAFAREHRLDTSSVSLAAFVRERVPSRPASLPEPNTLTPATTPMRSPPTSSTVIEVEVEAKSTSTSNLVGELRIPDRTRSRVFVGVGASVAVAAGLAFAVFTGGGSDSNDVRPAATGAEPSVTTPAAAAPASATPAPPVASEVPPDAGVAAAPVPTVTIDAGVEAAATRPVRPRPTGSQRPRPPAKTTPTPVRDPCAGWNPNSLSPPPPGCDPK